VLAAMAAGLETLAVAQQPAQAPQPDVESVTVRFSDPARPGMLRVNVMSGSISIKGTNRRDVGIEVKTAEERGGRGVGRGRGVGSNAPDTAGLRRLSQGGGFTVEEENNEMKIQSSMHRSSEFEIQVPAKTNLHLSLVNGRDIVVDSIEGDLEVNNVNGSVSLTNIIGSVVANSVNGGVLAKLTRVTAQKPMAFTALNGNVDVTLPASTKANLKLRSDMGEVLTDFDVQLRRTDTNTTEDARRQGGRFRLEVNRSIAGTINGGGPEFELRTFNGNVYVRKGAN
jgi:DUF4097 and DUF4098 domain-containing protein YvlB